MIHHVQSPERVTFQLLIPNITLIIFYLIFLQESSIFLLESFIAMVLFLIGDVVFYHFYLPLLPNVYIFIIFKAFVLELSAEYSFQFD